MLKKIIIAIVVAALLAGSENLFAEKKGDKSKEIQKQEQDQAKQPSQRMDGRGVRRRQMMQEHDKWLDELTKAYKDNDKKKMGELIEKMNQRRKEMREKMEARRERRHELREKRQEHSRFWGDCDERPRRGHGRLFGDDVDRPYCPGAGFRGRGVGRSCPRCSCRGMDRDGHGFRGKGRGKHGHGFGHGGMSKKGCGMGRQGHGFWHKGMKSHGHHGFKGRDGKQGGRRECRYSDWDW